MQRLSKIEVKLELELKFSDFMETQKLIADKVVTT